MSMRHLPRWLARMRSYEGLQEVPGTGTHPTIWRWLGAIQARWLGGDDAPWCGTALAGVMLEEGIAPPAQAYRAASWATWGTALSGPFVGAVGVLARPGGGHVTLAMGRDQRGNILGLGGNQRDGVRVSPFAARRFTAWRWPPGEPTASMMLLPTLASSDAPSTNEA